MPVWFLRVFWGLVALYGAVLLPLQLWVLWRER